MVRPSKYDGPHSTLSKVSWEGLPEALDELGEQPRPVGRRALARERNGRRAPDLEPKAERVGGERLGEPTGDRRGREGEEGLDRPRDLVVVVDDPDVVGARECPPGVEPSRWGPAVAIPVVGDGLGTGVWPARRTRLARGGENEV
jgi:hypothetical protein